MKYQLPNIPGHVAGKKAKLDINHEETVVSGRIHRIVLTGSQLDGTEMTIDFDGGCVTAYVREDTPHELEVDD